MDWTSWVLLMALSLASGAAGSFIYSRRAALLQAATSCLFRLRRSRRRGRSWRERSRPMPAPGAQRQAGDDPVVLIPDGRPWPLGPAVQLLELAWRWQVVHGTNLPLRARQGEGAYVWRPPLPARTSGDQRGAEAEH